MQKLAKIRQKYSYTGALPFSLWFLWLVAGSTKISTLPLFFQQRPEVTWRDHDALVLRCSGNSTHSPLRLSGSVKAGCGPGQFKDLVYLVRRQTRWAPWARRIAEAVQHASLFQRDVLLGQPAPTPHPHAFKVRFQPPRDLAIVLTGGGPEDDLRPSREVRRRAGVSHHVVETASLGPIQRQCRHFRSRHACLLLIAEWSGTLVPRLK